MIRQFLTAALLVTCGLLMPSQAIAQPRFAPRFHAHKIANVDGLQAALDAASVAGGAFKTVAVVTVNDAEGDYICDGTDDDVQIQQAIDAVSTDGGGIVFLKNGTYDIGAFLNLKSNCWLMGEGYATHLLGQASAGADLIHVEARADVRISDLRLDGNQANNTADAYNIRVRSSSKVRIQDVSSHDAKRASGGSEGEGIYVTASDHVFVTGCYVYDNGGVGIKYTNDLGACSYGRIENCNAYDNANDNILMFRVVSSWIVNCTSTGSGTDGITLHGTEVAGNTGAQRSGIIGCTAEDNAEDGIVGCTAGKECVISACVSRNNGNDGINLFWEATSNVINNCISVGNANYGIHIQGLSDNTRPVTYGVVANNVVRDNDSGDTNTYSGIHVTKSSSYNVITGNVSTGATQNYGIQIDDVGCTNNVIVGNYVAENRVAGINDAGTETYIWANVEDNVPQTEGKLFLTARPEDAKLRDTAGAALGSRNTTNYTGARPFIAFDDSTDESSAWSLVMPHEYTGRKGVTAELFLSSATEISGDMVFDVAFEKTRPGIDDLDIDDFPTTVSGTVTMDSTADSVVVLSIDLDDGSEMEGVAAGQMFRMQITRDADNVADTMTGDAELYFVHLRER